jgi:hypothetical protein
MHLPAVCQPEDDELMVGHDGREAGQDGVPVLELPHRRSEQFGG